MYTLAHIQCSMDLLCIFIFSSAACVLAQFQYWAGGVRWRMRLVFHRQVRRLLQSSGSICKSRGATCLFSVGRLGPCILDDKKDLEGHWWNLLAIEFLGYIFLYITILIFFNYIYLYIIYSKCLNIYRLGSNIYI